MGAPGQIKIRNAFRDAFSQYLYECNESALPSPPLSFMRILVRSSNGECLHLTSIMRGTPQTGMLDRLVEDERRQ